MMPRNSKNRDLWEAEYRKLLDKKDPLDKAIIELAENHELKIDLVEVKEADRNQSDKYSRRSLPHRGKYSS